MRYHEENSGFRIQNSEDSARHGADCRAQNQGTREPGAHRTQLSELRYHVARKECAMTITKRSLATMVAWPDHRQLPCEDGTFKENFQEHPQTILLTDSIQPLLDHIHTDGQYAIGQDCGIYWNLAESLGNDPVHGAKAPDWFYVPNVPPLLNGEIRRSYVLWHERVAPLVLLEIVSGDGSEEHDGTPMTGKFWIYERAIQAAYYAIFDAARSQLKLNVLNDGSYHPVEPDERGNLPLLPLKSAATSTRYRTRGVKRVGQSEVRSQKSEVAVCYGAVADF
jgi:hypothetical protein